MSRAQLPILVIGAGLAGLTTALVLAGARRPVIVLAKGWLQDTATARAQGGMVGVIAPDDSVEDHVQDTLVAGAGLADAEAARFVSQRSAGALAWLRAQGVGFSQAQGGPLGLHLTREGGHRVRRIAHAADATGRAIHETLLARALERPCIDLREDVMAIDLLVAPGQACGGARVLDMASGQVQTLHAAAVVLATGGAGQLYPHTTNPASATGDGIAMAWRAGCQVANLEFVQFHPTCLVHPAAQGFLLSEALRGEGAWLRLPDGPDGDPTRGTRFMPAHDARAELAPRDIVARAIEAEMRRLRTDHVLLDATHLGAAFLAERFPTLLARCAALGIDITRVPVPVAPAAHYVCGGIVTDLCGLTNVRRLYAVGENACTGLHGANRLASNSLLECVVLGRSCAGWIGASITTPAREEVPVAADHPVAAEAGPEAGADLNAQRMQLQALMARHAGIVRDSEGLATAQAQVAEWRAALGESGAPSRERLELRNLLTVAALVLRSAASRRESRGLHYNSDWPEGAASPEPTLLCAATREPVTRNE